MKKHIIYLFSFLLIFSVFSCKKKSGSDPTPEVSNVFTASIDGTAWTPQSFTASYRYSVFVFNAVSSNGQRVILRMKLVNGHEADQAFYEFAYDDDNSVGIFDEKIDEAEFATNQYDNTRPVPGTITFTKFDKTSKLVSGTYQIHVKRVTDGGEKYITGSFENVSYDDVIATTPTKAMSSSIDGTSWTAASVVTTSSTLQKIIQVKGNASNGSAIWLSVPYKVIPGSYKIALFGSLAAQYNPSVVSEMKGETGTIVVTFHDPDAKVIKGTFSFQAIDQVLGQKSVTAGNFVGVY